MTRKVSDLRSRRTGSRLAWRNSRKAGMVVARRHRVHRHYAVGAQGAQHGQAPPVDQRLAAHPLADQCPGMAPRHVGQDPALVQKTRRFWLFAGSALTTNTLMPSAPR